MEDFEAWLQCRWTRNNSPRTSHTAPLSAQNSPCSLKMARFGEFCACRENFVPLSPPTTQARRTLYRMRDRREVSRHNRTPGVAGVESTGGSGESGRGAGACRQDQCEPHSTAGVEDAGGTGGHSRGAGGRRQGLPGFETPGVAGAEGTGGTGGPGCSARGRWRGLAGHRGDAPGHTSAARRHWRGGRRRVRRARAGFETRRRVQLGRQVSRAAGPDGARNTSGATNNSHTNARVRQRGGYRGTRPSLSHCLVEAQAE